ncbi:MAG TPA: bifunctional diguanylate cyclase/phosphodiesterase [Hyphomicrobiaceae bacterium]|nr:bifunctional diguanylate cyclase/phosphodiesterase [Hyphomicrobiaceae bacterium]
MPQKTMAIAASPSNDLAPKDFLKSDLESEALNLVGIRSCIDETAYIWDLISDTIEWENNAAEVLGVDSLDTLATGHDFNGLIAAEHISRRQEAITNRLSDDTERGIPYRVQYRFQPGGRRSSLSIWLEDHGRFWPGEDGKPLLARGIVRIIDDSYIEEQRLLYHSDHDELTGQLNRIRLTEALGAVIARSIRNNSPSTFMVISINNLTVINETFGFDIGDEVIAAVGRLIRDKLRAGDTLGRYSSNKFGVVINDCGPGAMQIAAERFMKAVRDTSIRTTACPLTATISIGGAVVPDQASTVHHVMNCALQALDRARAKRFDCFVAYEPSSMHETVRQKSMTVADDVISALDENRMRLVLQPIVDANTHIPKLYECLLRLHKEDGSIISAGEFVPVAEQLGMARLIDRHTLELAIDLLRQRPSLHMSLNVSGLTSLDRDWLASLSDLTQRDRAITERLTIEITETAAIQDIDQSAYFVDCLKDMGCQVAIDDFGAGYTSFRNLKRLNVDMIKIDGAFVKNLLADNSNQVFISTMVEIARTFGMKTVAEWVGDVETAKLLAGAGIDYLQGYLYGLPIPSEDYADVATPLPLLRID